MTNMRFPSERLKRFGWPHAAAPASAAGAKVEWHGREIHRRRHEYTGDVTKLGVDIGYTSAGVLVRAVVTRRKTCARRTRRQ
ncbi:MAG: DUF992 domain-containing protein [Hyphomonadaceae bacterium]|nr:DUF992 domain-containing protein [Hyphomonadaceae bacterium]